MDSLLAAECGALAVAVNAGFDLLSASSYEPGDIANLYYGTLIISNLVHSRQNWKAHGKRIKAVTVQSFTKWAIQIPNKARNGTGV